MSDTDIFSSDQHSQSVQIYEMQIRPHKAKNGVFLTGGLGLAAREHTIALTNAADSSECLPLRLAQ